MSATTDYRWPAEGLTRIPDWIYTSEEIYAREQQRRVLARQY